MESPMQIVRRKKDDARYMKVAIKYIKQLGKGEPS